MPFIVIPYTIHGTDVNVGSRRTRFSLPIVGRAQMPHSHDSHWRPPSPTTRFGTGNKRTLEEGKVSLKCPLSYEIEMIEIKTLGKQGDIVSFVVVVVVVGGGDEMVEKDKKDVARG